MTKSKEKNKNKKKQRTKQKQKNQKKQKNKKKQNHGGAVLGKTWVVFFVFFGLSLFSTQKTKAHE